MNVDLAGRARTAGRLLSLGTCALSLGIAPLSTMAEPPSSVFGQYFGAGCPTARGAGDCLPTTAADHVRIAPDKSTGATVSVKMIFDKGHVCALEGGATWTDGRFILQADGLDPEKPCRLGLRITDSTLALEDPGALCREVYCGTRGAFDGARFKKRPGNPGR